MDAPQSYRSRRIERCIDHMFVVELNEQGLVSEMQHHPACKFCHESFLARVALGSPPATYAMRPRLSFV